MNSPEKNKLESVFSNFSKIHRTNLKNIGQLYRVTIHFHSSHPQTKMIFTSFGRCTSRAIFNKIEPLF